MAIDRRSSRSLRAQGVRPILGVLSVSILIAAACSVPRADPPASGPPGADPSAAAATTSPTNQVFDEEANGLVLTVTVDPVVVAPGDLVTFTTSVRNDRSEPVDYGTAACGGAASVQLSVELPKAEGGRTWTGIQAAFKDYVRSDANGPGIVPAFDLLRVDVSPKPCRGVQVEAIMAPGETVTSSMTWSAEIVEGVPAMVGSVAFTATVLYERQDRSSSLLAYKQFTVEGSVSVVGEGRPLADVGAVIDAVLADDEFARWLADKPRSTWTNTNLFLTSYRRAEGIVPAGPSWELDLFREDGVPRNWAIAFIDPFDASVRSITYCNIPCDR